MAGALEAGGFMAPTIWNTTETLKITDHIASGIFTLYIFVRN